MPLWKIMGADGDAHQPPVGEGAAGGGGVAGTTARKTARSPSRIVGFRWYKITLCLWLAWKISLSLPLYIHTWNICHRTHLKSARAILFIQERIVFLADLSPAHLLLPKDKLGPLENKVVATVFNGFALAYIYIGQASPSPGPAACALRQKNRGGLSLFLFFFNLFTLVWFIC